MSDPALVVIEPQILTYTRYLGRTKHVKVKADRLLRAEEIEELRVRPELCVEGLAPAEPVDAA